MFSNIVPATDSDREQIMNLYKEQLGREFCAWDEDYPSEDTIDFDLSRDALFVMKDDQKDSIIAAISIDLDENVEELECWNKDLFPGGELARLAVTPSMQGRGIARQMLQYGMQALKERGYKSIHFLVNKYNKPALKSYSKFNFDVAGECHLYDQDFICYEKEL
jgi:ribosomal protein S18 acetylase RimI-like enzyme